MIRSMIVAPLLVLVLMACSPRQTPETAATPAARPDAAADQGPCVVPPKGEPRMCTQQYDPVCGCDGRTYGNACVAAAQGVQRMRPGRCEEPHPDTED